MLLSLVLTIYLQLWEFTGEFDSQEFSDVMDSIINCCKKYNVPCGDHVVQPDQKLLNSRIDQGYRFIAYGTDGIFTYINSQNPRK